MGSPCHDMTTEQSSDIIAPLVTSQYGLSGKDW